MQFVQSKIRIINKHHKTITEATKSKCRKRAKVAFVKSMWYERHYAEPELGEKRLCKLILKWRADDLTSVTECPA